MKAAVVTEYGIPRYAEFRAPTAGRGQLLLDVLAAGVNHVDLAKCAGAFYRPVPTFPWIAGTDGVGITTEGRRVYFAATVSPFGSLAEQTLVPNDEVFDIADGVDNAVAAALGNAGLAAWLSLHWAGRLQSGERVLVLGATGAVGALAVQLARHAHAGCVIAAGRSRARLARSLELGADAVIELDPVESLAERLRGAAPDGVDVIIDLLWGEPARAALEGATATGCRHVGIGNLASPSMTVPAVALRANHVSLIGFAVFHAPLELRRTGYLELTEQAANGELEIDLETLPLEDIQQAWQLQREGAGRKLVITPSD